MNLLFLGDVVGKPGRRAVREVVPDLRSELAIDAVIANGENLAGGSGLTQETAEEVFEAGVDVLTSGNHLFDRRQSLDYIAAHKRVARPANYPPGTPGRDLVRMHTPGGTLAVACVLGRVFMRPFDDPFRTVDALVERTEDDPFLVIDVHAETTSEKMALGWHLDGRASMVVGTHTHIPTADERILPGGAAYVTDVGMTGPYDSIIGMEKKAVLANFITGMHHRFKPAQDDIRLLAVLVEMDPETGKSKSIRRIERRLEERTP
jgi:metallophosphoesterase (TIGR00282 family)